MNEQSESGQADKQSEVQQVLITLTNDTALFKIFQDHCVSKY